MRATRILHASVNVQGSLDATTAFYADLLSLRSADRPVIPGVEGHWFAVGDAQLHLVDAPHAGAPAIDPTGPHLCVGVEDLEGAVAELDERRIPYLTAQQGDVVQVWIVDPSGFTIELQADPAVATSR